MRYVVLSSLLALAIVGSGCAHPGKASEAGTSSPPSAAPAGPADGLTESELSRRLPGVDSSSLSPRQRAHLADFAEDAICPCAPKSLAECVREDTACTPVTRMLELSKRLIVAGQPPFAVTTRVESYVHSFATSRRRPVEAVGASKGPEDAPITLVEFSDFQCPACRVAHPVLSAIADKYPGQVRVVFRHFPLPQHEHAEVAARAAVYAEQQGKFWEFATLAFERQDALHRTGLEDIAREVGLDADAMWSAVDDADATAERVASDKAAGFALPIQGTPTLFVNGRPFLLPITLEYLSWTIDDELEWLANGGAWAAR